MTVVNFKIWQRSPARGDTCLDLLERRALTGALQYLRGEVFDTFDPVSRQQRLAKLSDIQPFVWRAFNASKVKIEPIHVNVGFQAVTLGNAEARPRRIGFCASATEATGEMMQTTYRRQPLAPSTAKKSAKTQVAVIFLPNPRRCSGPRRMRRIYRLAERKEIKKPSPYNLLPPGMRRRHRVSRLRALPGTRFDVVQGSSRFFSRFID